jgi:hypothetical protein
MALPGGPENPLEAGPVVPGSRPLLLDVEDDPVPEHEPL